jgi:hypothetical protein
MGIAALIDIIGSMIIGGYLLVTVISFNSNASQNTYGYSGELIVQENIVAVVDILEYDLRRIGYCQDPTKIPNPSLAILSADSSYIKYLADDNKDGNLDTVEYYLGTSDELSETPNPEDRMLFRSVNGQSLSANLGITVFKMTFYDVLGVQLYPPLTVPTGIASMQIDVKCENSAAFDEQYRYSFWRQVRLASRNLYNR